MTPIRIDDIDRVKRNSKRSALLTAVGALMIFGVLGYSVWELNHLSVAIAGKKDELRSLEEAKSSLQKQKDDLQNEVTRLEKYSEILFNQYRDTSELSETLQKMDGQAVQIRSLAPIQAVATPRAAAVKISDDPQQYEFSLWVEISKERQSEIDKVSYFFDHPSFHDKLIESTDPKNNYGVSYRGWGALRRVIITLHLKNGKSSKLAFDMADAINKADAKSPQAKVPSKGNLAVPVK